MYENVYVIKFKLVGIFYMKILLIKIREMIFL